LINSEEASKCESCRPSDQNDEADLRIEIEREPGDQNADDRAKSADHDRVRILMVIKRSTQRLQLKRPDL